MRLGIFAKTFVRGSLGETLDAVVAHEIEAIQFNMAVVGGPSLPAEIPPAVAEEVRAAVDARGLTISALLGPTTWRTPIPRCDRRDGRGSPP